MSYSNVKIGKFADYHFKQVLNKSDNVCLYWKENNLKKVKFFSVTCVYSVQILQKCIHYVWPRIDCKVYSANR